MSAASGSGLAPLEIASGLVFGVEPGGAPSEPASPQAVLEAAVLPALRRPPCLVSFSGGRDSSCVLGFAARVARCQGLPLPVPATLCFPQVAEADETEWQERVVSCLELDDWVRIELGDELDAVGPTAIKVLRRSGLLWPFNAYVHLPLFEAARGGSLLTGFGGDETFEHMTPDRVNAVLARRVRPAPRDVLRLGLAAAPWRVRSAVLRRRNHVALPWLLPAAQRAFDRELATDTAREPRNLAARAAWWSRRRTLRVAARSLGLLAAGEDVLIAHPLAEPALAAAILRAPELAHGNRARRLEAVFGDLLPRDLYGRSSKASFNRAFFGSHARALVADWGGGHIDASLVDVEALREVWGEVVPDGRSYLLLQSIWLTGATAAHAAATSSPLPAIPSGEDVEARTTAAPPT